MRLCNGDAIRASIGGKFQVISSYSQDMYICDIHRVSAGRPRPWRGLNPAIRLVRRLMWRRWKVVVEQTKWAGMWSKCDKRSASGTASERFVRSAKLADYMPQAILVTCPVLELQSTLGEDADFLIAFQRELPPVWAPELGAAARNHSHFVQDYQRRFLQLPSDAAVLAYSSAQHLAQAIAAAGSVPDAVAALLRQRGQVVAGQVVQVQAGNALQVSLAPWLSEPRQC
eukprot:s1166_g15.t1